MLCGFEYGFVWLCCEVVVGCLEGDGEYDVIVVVIGVD